MSKVQYRFLQGIKTETHKETRSNMVYTLDEHGNETVDMFAGMYDEDYSGEVNNGFSDDLYGEDTTSEQNSITEGFSDNVYEKSMQQHKSTIEVDVKNTDEFLQYQMNIEKKVTAKEARTSTEVKLPFVVIKSDVASYSNTTKSKKNLKTATIKETDTIYKLQTKMRRSGEFSEFNRATPIRIGFINVSDSPRLDKKLDLDKKYDNIVGILNDKFVISKLKGFNKKKLGYTPVDLMNEQSLDDIPEVTEAEVQLDKDKVTRNDKIFRQQQKLKAERERTGTVDRYVEVVENRGYSWLMWIVLLIIAILCIGKLMQNQDFKFNARNLTLYKTEEIIENKESNVEISLNATPTLKNGSLNINFETTKAYTDSDTEKVVVSIIIKDKETDEVLWLSDESVDAGSYIESVIIKPENLSSDLRQIYFNNDNTETVYRTATVICETNKIKTNSTSGLSSYLGEIEQDISIKIKPQEKVETTEE